LADVADQADPEPKIRQKKVKTKIQVVTHQDLQEIMENLTVAIQGKPKPLSQQELISRNLELY
jgi:hypothetical protein